MQLRVLGCHGANSLHHRNVSFLIDERVALDAGSVASGLSVSEQASLEAVLVTHAHLDHVADLGPLSDTRCLGGGPPLVVAGMAETIDALRTHFFNGVLWPDFTRLPDAERPALELRVIELERDVALGGLTVRAIPVHHSVPSCGFVVSDQRTALAYSGDTGPTNRLWQVLNEIPELRAVITEVSFPDHLAELAQISGHLTPATLRSELAKLDGRPDLQLLLYGMKPIYVDEIEAELAADTAHGARVLAAGELLEF